MASDRVVPPFELPELQIQGPVVVPGRVKTEWLDYNRHMNVGYYSIAFDEAAEIFCQKLGCAAEYVRHQLGMLFVLESHLTFQRELREGEEFEVRSQILNFDEKRMQIFSAMYSTDRQHLAATNEIMLMHIDFESRRAAPWPAFLVDRIGRMAAGHAKLPRPEQVGRIISFARRAAKL